MDRLLGRVARVLDVSSGAWVKRAGAGVAAAAQDGENHNGANYGSKANNTNQKDNDAHWAGPLLILGF